MQRPEVSFSADYVDVLLKDLEKAKETHIQNKRLKTENANLRDAVAMAIYELHFVADEHDCDQCREAVKNIVKIAKGVKDDQP